MCDFFPVFQKIEINWKVHLHSSHHLLPLDKQTEEYRKKWKNIWFIYNYRVSQLEIPFQNQEERIFYPISKIIPQNTNPLASYQIKDRRR